MAKIVIIRGAYPTAVAADVHARRIVDILRTKYGHEVVVHKIPLGETEFGIVRNLSPVEGVKLLARQAALLPKAKEIGKKHDAFTFAFNAHGTGEVQPNDQPENFPISEHDHERYFLDHSRGIKFITSPGHPKSYVIELPAHFVDVIGKRRAKKLERIKAIERMALPNKKTRRVGNGDILDGASRKQWKIASLLSEHYHTQVAPASAKVLPMQKRFLSPVISKRVAAYIHKIVKGKTQRAKEISKRKP